MKGITEQVDGDPQQQAKSSILVLWKKE